MGNMILRNMRLYFRDRVSVFFSLLSVMITIALYVFFLADTMLSGDMESIENSRRLLDLWLLGGLLSITSVTATLASYGVMVQDRYKQIMKDFNATSFPRWKLILSYILAALFTGIIMSIFTFLAGQIFLCLKGGDLISRETILKLFGIMMLSVAAGSAMMFFLSSFLRTSSAFSNASVLIGTLIGFLMGIYVPIGVLPSFAQNIVRFFPMTQGCAMYRSILVDDMMQEVFTGAGPEMIHEFQQQMGLVLQYGDVQLSLFQNGLILLGTCVVFYALSLCFFNMKRK